MINSKKLKVSIIIPIYNSDAYLDRCLRSVVQQSYPNLEIILVNDGSTDSSPQIINDYASKDNRVITIHKENGGIGSAYKAAFEVMTGDYVLFVDSDDWLELDAVENIVKLAYENDADMVSFGIRAYNPQGKEVNLPTLKNIDLINTTNEAILKTHFEILKHPTLVRLYKRELFKDVVVFEQNIGIDEMLTPQLLAKCNRAVYTSEVYYCVFLRQNSISRTNQKLNTMHDTILVYKFLREYFQSQINLKQYQQLLNLKYFKILFGYKKLLLANKINSIDNYKLSNELVFVFNEIKRNKEFKAEEKSFKLKSILIVYYPFLYRLFMKYSKK